MKRFHMIARAALATCALYTPTTLFAQASPSAFTWATRYDAQRRVTGTIAPDPDGGGTLRFAAVRNTYDGNGWLTKIENGELANWQSDAVAPASWTGFTVYRTVNRAYDADGRMIREDVLDSTSNINTIAQASYDAADRPICQTVRMNPAVWPSPPANPCTLGTAGSYGQDRITRNSYVGARLVKVQKAYGTTLQQDYVTYTHNANSQIETVTDANGATAKLTYDLLGRQDRWYFPSKTTAGVASTTDYEAYGYDLAANRTSLRKRDARVINYSYDALNRMSLKDIPDGTAADVYYAYDNRGLQIKARFASATGEGIDTGYDNLGRVSSGGLTLDGVTRTLTYQYDGDGNRTRVTYPDATYVSYTSDGMDRPLAVLLNGVTTIAAWTYNARTERSRQDRGNTTFATYSYDGISRLTGMFDELGGSSGDIGYGFGYNPASQMTGRTRSNDAYVFGQEPNVSRGYVVNGLNQYTAVGSRPFTYDANGNLTSDGRTTFAYDVENRLVSASGAQRAALRYDPAGRLYETATASGIGATRFLYDGDAIVAEYAASGTILRRYVHGAGIDDPLVRYEGTGTTAPIYLSTDHQGSVTAQTDASGTPIAINAYNEWGVPRTTNQGRFQYTGQAWIAELRLYHYKARVYSPELGRFLQTDPVGYDDQVNLYAYVTNDPVNRVDPTGLEDDDGWGSRVAQFAWGTAEVVVGAAGMIAGAAGDIGSGGLTIATAGGAAPITVPAAAVSTAVIVGGAALAADGVRNMTGSILNSTNNQGDGRSGGGRNGQKSNPDRVASAQGRVEKAQGELQSLKSQPNKTPADKAQISKLERQIKTDQIRVKESENHSMKDKR